MRKCLVVVAFVFVCLGCLGGGSKGVATRPPTGGASAASGSSTQRGVVFVGGRSFGVTRPGRIRRVAATIPGRWDSARWISPDILVAFPPFSRAGPAAALFRYRPGHLQHLPFRLPWPRAWQLFWSPDGRRVAIERAKLVPGGYASRFRIYIAPTNGAHPQEIRRGSLLGWSPHGEVVFRPGGRSTIDLLDPATGQVTSLLTLQAPQPLATLLPNAAIGTPVWSADRRYLAYQVRGLTQPRSTPGGEPVFGAIIIATAAGRPLRLITSPYVVSMIAWSPVGHRLAYTTSGFPAPHQLFIVDAARHDAPRLLFQTRRHFDWVTWHPTGETLLLDDLTAGAAARRPGGKWRLIPADGSHPERLPRLGKYPLWCCPPNHFDQLPTGI